MFPSESFKNQDTKDSWYEVDVLGWNIEAIIMMNGILKTIQGCSDLKDRYDNPRGL